MADGDDGPDEDVVADGDDGDDGAGDTGAATEAAGGRLVIW